MNLEKLFENLYLLVVFGVLLFLGVSILFDNRLQHEFPYGYLASDAFQQQTRAEGIKDAGNYRLEPFYIVKGYKDVLGYYPPVVHHLGIILHFSSGIPVFDTVYFMVFFGAILASFVMYIIIRAYNRQIAMLSLPLSILIFSNKSYIGFLWGHWASITGQLFLICIFWAMMRINLDKIEVLLGLFVGALALSHTSELMYGVWFILIYSIILLVHKKFGWEFFKKILIAGVISGIIAAYSLFIFANSFMVVNPYKFEVSRDWGGTPIFYLTDFGLLLVFLAIGAVASFIMAKKIGIPAIAGFFMLAVGYANYIGFGIRAFQPRMFWPIYLSVFFGLGLYALIRFVPRRIRAACVFGAGLLLILALSNVFAIPGMPAYSRVSSPGLMDQWHWEAFQWLGQNTPQDAKLYFFYGDVYDQDAILRNSKRVHAQVTPEDFIAALQNRSIKRVYQSDAPADHGAGMPYKESLFRIALHQDEDEDSLLKQRYMDICQFEYHIFDKASRQPALAQFNMLLVSEELKKGAQIAFENQAAVVLKNNNVGDDCIEERNF